MTRRLRPSVGPAPINPPDLRLRHPAPELADLIGGYFFVTAAASFHDWLYPDWGNIRFALQGDWSVGALNAHGPEEPGGHLYGPTDRWTHVSGGPGRGAGILLTPLGWDRLVRIPAQGLANRRTRLQSLLGPPGEAIEAELRAHQGSDWDAAGAALFDRLLVARLENAPPPDPAVRALHRALADRPSEIGPLAAAAGLSTAELRETCKRAFGFGPKRLLRRERLADTLRRIRADPAPRPAILRDPGYSDQPHFNREFREFMGLSPRAYLAVPRPLMAQAARVWPETPFPITGPEPARGDGVV